MIIPPLPRNASSSSFNTMPTATLVHDAEGHAATVFFALEAVIGCAGLLFFAACLWHLARAWLCSAAQRTDGQYVSEYREKLLGTSGSGAARSSPARKANAGAAKFMTLNVPPLTLSDAAARKPASKWTTVRTSVLGPLAEREFSLQVCPRGLGGCSHCFFTVSGQLICPECRPRSPASDDSGSSSSGGGGGGETWLAPPADGAGRERAQTLARQLLAEESDPQSQRSRSKSKGSGFRALNGEEKEDALQQQQLPKKPQPRKKKPQQRRRESHMADGQDSAMAARLAGAAAVPEDDDGGGGSGGAWLRPPREAQALAARLLAEDADPRSQRSRQRTTTGFKPAELLDAAAGGGGVDLVER